MSDHLSQLVAYTIYSMEMYSAIFSSFFYFYDYFYSFIHSVSPSLCPGLSLFFDFKSVMLMNRTTNVTLMQFSFIIADADVAFTACNQMDYRFMCVLCVCECIFHFLSNWCACACLIDQTSSCYFMIFETHRCAQTHTRTHFGFIKPYTHYIAIYAFNQKRKEQNTKKREYTCLFNIWWFSFIYILPFTMSILHSAAISTQHNLEKIRPKIQKPNSSFSTKINK